MAGSTILGCTVGAPEERYSNLAWLAPWHREYEETTAMPFGEPGFTYEHDDQINVTRLYAEVRGLAHAEGDRPGEARAVLRLGAATAALGDITAGMALLEEAQRMADALDDQHLIAAALGERGLAAARAGDRRHALALLSQAAGIAELAGDVEAAEAWTERRDLVLSGEWPGADTG